MGHVDAVYSFGTRTEPHWIALGSIVRPFLFEDDRPRFRNTGGLRTARGSPNLTSVFNDSTDVSDRDFALFFKYSELNRLLLERVEVLADRDIVFTDAILPSDFDPKFLFSYLKAQDVSYPSFAPSWYASRRSAGRVFHDPFSPMSKLSDAVLLLAASNPDAWHDKVIWPLSPVAFPYSVDADKLEARYAFPGVFRSVDFSERRDGRLGLGSMVKSLDDVLSSVKVGSFSCSPFTYDHDELYDMFIQNELAFESQIKRIRESYDGDPREYFLSQLPYSAFIRRELASLFYSMVIERAAIVRPVLYASKGSDAFRILDRAIKHVNARNPSLSKPVSMKLVGFEDNGPMETADKSSYGILDRSALERLNGHMVNPWSARSRKPANAVVPIRVDRHDYSLDPCPFAPVFCERVYDGGCARTRKECSACSRDLFEVMRDPDYFADVGLGRDWISWYNASNSAISSIADLVSIKCDEHKFNFYSVEQIAMLLNLDDDLEVYTSAEFIDGRRLFSDDRRRDKGRLSWKSERNNRVVFPLVHPDDEARGPFCRISSLGVSCDLARIFAMNPHVPPAVLSSEAAAFGTAGHFLMNGHLSSPLLQEQLWSSLDLPVVSRGYYTERSLSLRVQDTVWSGHSDCVLAMGPSQDDLEDLVIVDLKTSVKTYYPRRKYTLQLCAYALYFDQLMPDTFKNFYLVVVNRPFISRLSRGAPFNQSLTVVKVRNDPSDGLYQVVGHELSRTVGEQRLLLRDNEYLRDYFGRKQSRGACDVPHLDFTRTGCFDDQRAKCLLMRGNIDKYASLEEYLHG